MKTKIIVKCDIAIKMGEVGGYHSKDDLERIRKAFCNEALTKLNKIIEGMADISIANPKFMITLTDDNF